MQLTKPKMILFDYGQTLLLEDKFDGTKGTRAVLDTCVSNPQNITAEEIQALADTLNEEMGRYHPEARHRPLLEIHNHPFQNYLYEYFNIKVMVSPLEMETVFWNAAAPAKLTAGISELLDFLNKNGIRTGVISNISMSGGVLANRINHFLPRNQFSFIIASSEYVFRKPSPHIFQVALKKAQLPPSGVWHCGDNIQCDIEGASKCGITPVWYTGTTAKKGQTPGVPFLEIKAWAELIELLEKQR